MNAERQYERGVEHALRDLMSLLALPALWAGRDGYAIVGLMSEAIERIVPLDVCYVDVPILPDTAPLRSLRLAGRAATAAELDDWKGVLLAWRRLPIGSAVNVSETPVGSIRMIRLSMGFSSGQGSIWFGAAAASFPSVTQIAFLRAATSQAATGLQAARAAHEREEANRSKDEFLALLGHELRNPLAPITTALGLIKRENRNRPDKYYEIIERQVAHLSRLVEDLLDVSRITRGKIELERESLRLSAIVTRAIEGASPLIEQRNQCLSVSIANHGAQVFGDPTRLVQVFGNLLNNAAKYTQVGGDIRVEVRAGETHVTVSVQDNGAGITPELMPKLFDIFEQGRTTIDRAKGGLGIGLALVKNLVELHGGTVRAHSEGAESGSTFTVELPLATAQELASAGEVPAAPIEAAPSGNGLRVLLVDDHADGLSVMEVFLRSVGFDVATAMDPIAALDIADAFQPDIAVLDIGLPGMDGYELAGVLRARSRNPALRLFALTGYGRADDVRRAQGAGFERHFAKPVSLAEIVEALNAGHPGPVS